MWEKQGLTNRLRDAEDRLRDLTERHHAVVDKSVSGIITIDANGVIESANPAIERIFGYPALSLIGKSISILMTEAARHDAGFARYLAGGSAKMIGPVIEVNGRRADGEVFPLQISVNEFAQDKRRMFTGVINDISQQRQAERLLAATIQNMTDGFIIYDADDRIIFCNDKMRELHPSMADMLVLGKSFSEVLEAVASRGLFDDPQADISIGRARRQGYHLDPDGIQEHHTPEGRSFPEQKIRLADGSTVTIHSDNTAQRNLQEEIRRNEERLIVSQQFAKIGTWDWNIQTDELIWSDQVAPLFGLDDGLVNTSDIEFSRSVHCDDQQRVNEAGRATKEHGAPYDIQYRAIWPDGSSHWMHERGDVVRDAEGTPIRMLGVVSDISDSKQLQAELLDARDRAERSNAAKSDFLSSMSHELRTP